MNHLSLFSGIGGFDLAAEWMGWDNIAHCEINPFCRRILNYYWPNSISYADIKTTDFTIHRGNIDILTGGFPCQPFSVAGKRKGTEDDRHLWPEMLRAIREISPRWIVGENVYGIANWNGGLVFEQVQSDLETQGYKVQPVILPAVSVNADHRRDRVLFIAYSNLSRQPGSGRTIHECSTTKKEDWKKYRAFDDGRWPDESELRRQDDGLSSRLDGITFPDWSKESITGFANAVVPQLIYQIFKTIKYYEHQ